MLVTVIVDHVHAAAIASCSTIRVQLAIRVQLNLRGARTCKPGSSPRHLVPHNTNLAPHNTNLMPHNANPLSRHHSGTVPPSLTCLPDWTL